MLLHLKKAFLEVELLDHFAFGYKNLQVFVIRESQEKVPIEKIVKYLIVKNDEPKTRFIKLSQVGSAQSNEIYSNTLPKTL